MDEARFIAAHCIIVTSFVMKLFRIVFSIYGFLVFLILMLLLFPLIFIASFFGAVTGGNIIYYICRFWANACFFLWGIWHRNIFEGPKSKRHAVIFVFNHLSYLDIPIILKTFQTGNIRILGKEEMARVPIFGFIYKRAVISVNRNSTSARAGSVKKLKRMLEKNISVVMAPEGTFNMSNRPLSSFYSGAFKVALETNTPIQPVLFLDAYDRLHHSSVFSFNPGRSRSVFLPEITLEKYSANDVDALKTEVYTTMESALIRYKASWIK